MCTSLRKERFILVRNFLDRLSKKSQISNLMKICSVGVKLCHADRRTVGPTDMTKLTVAFDNFANAPKNVPNKL